MRIKGKKILAVIGLLCGVDFAYASSTKGSEMLKHHRGIQKV